MVNDIRVFFLGVFFLSFYTGYSQGIKKLEKLGDEAYSESDFYGASVAYKQILEEDSTTAEYLYKYASSLRNLFEYDKAEHYYSRALRADKKSEFPETIFWLATMQKNNKKYAEAKKNFKKASSKYAKDKSSYFYKKSLKEMESCDFAVEALKTDTSSATIESLGQKVNSVHSDFAPFLMNDYLYYSTLRYPDSSTRTISSSVPYFIKIYRTNVVEENQNQEELSELINAPELHNANGSFSSDGSLFYFSRCDLKNRCDIWVSSFASGNFSPPLKLEGDINDQRSTSTQPTISVIDQDTVLFYSSNREGGEGGLDIWYSNIKNGKAVKSFNAGKVVNTPDDDIAPFYSALAKMLFFSSTWHNGLGGFDVFKSEGLPGNFTNPINLGIPFNTSANDIYYSADSTGRKGYFASNRKGVMKVEGEACCNDIYKFKYPEPKVIVKEEPADTIIDVVKTIEELNKVLPLTLYFHNDEPNPRSRDTLTKKNYVETYKEYLGLKEMYRREYSKGLSGEEKTVAQNEIEKFFDEYVTKSVENLNSATAVLLKVLQEGHQIELTIKGYASPLAKSNYNLILTKRRISSLKNYLMEYGDGVFKKYIDKTAENGGALTFVEVPFGSYKAKETVSSNLNDLKNSVYSRDAALERKIEIIAISLKDSAEIISDNKVKPILKPVVELEEKSHDFGKVQYGKVVEHQFKLKNTGNAPLIIQTAIGSCGCTVPAWSHEPIPPGGETYLKVTFDTKGKSGKQFNTVQIITNASERPVVLSITADVVLK